MKTTEKRKNGSLRVFTLNNEPSMTQQQFKEQCDVNNIIAKFKKTGQITHINARQGAYLDLTKAGDFQSSMDKIIKAQDAFMTLPAETRKKFGNDPKNFLEFMDNPKNNAEAIKLGLRVKNEIKPDPVLTELQTLNKTLSKNTKKASTED